MLWKGQFYYTVGSVIKHTEKTVRRRRMGGERAEVIEGNHCKNSGQGD